MNDEIRAENTELPGLHLIKSQLETPIDTLPPKARFGAMVRRARNAKKMSLREAAAMFLDEPVEGEKDSRIVEFGEIERGKRPPTEEIAKRTSSAFNLSYDELIQAARDWNDAIWNSDAVVLKGAEFSIASLSPTREQTDELRDELKRILVDLEHLVETVEEVGEGVAARVERSMARVKAVLADANGPPEIPMGEFPDIVLGDTSGFNHCERCKSTGIDPEVEMVDGIHDWELRCKDCNGTGQDIPAFLLHRVYVDQTGRLMRTIGQVVSVAYGACFVAEHSNRGDFAPIAMNDHKATLGWREVPKTVWWKHWLDANPNDPVLKMELERDERDEANIAKARADDRGQGNS